MGTKWAVVHRNETKSDATNSLLTRGNTINGTIRYPGQRACLRAADGLWATTLLRESEQNGLLLYQGGETLEGTTSAQLADHPAFQTSEENEKTALRYLGLSTVGDLTLIERGTRKWNDDLRELSKITDEVMEGHCPQGNMKLRPQQCWLVQDSTEAYIAEILGFIRDDVVIRKWQLQLNKKKQKGKTVREMARPRHARADKFLGKAVVIHPDAYTRGEGSNCTVNVQLIYAAKLRVLLGSDKHDREHGLHRIVCGVIPEIQPTLHKISEPRLEIVERIRALVQENRGPWDIFVDGSYRKTGGPFTSVLFTADCTVDASASLVFVERREDWKNGRIISLEINEGGKHKPTSAFPMELLALTTADLLIRKLDLDAVVFSDCTGALKAIGDTGRLRYLAKKQNLIVLQQSKWLASRMRHVRSHPERYAKNRDLWTRHMWGNHLADRSSAADYRDYGIACDTHLSTCSVDQALELYTHTDTLYWANPQGEPTLRCFDEVFDENLLYEYERKRDQYRQQKLPPDPPKWAGPMHRSVRFATECAELKTRSQGDKARMLRLIWDHFQHGGNCRKMGLSEGACNLCNGVDSARHWMSECMHPGAVSSRAATEQAIEEHLATLTEQAPKLELFIKMLATCVTSYEDGHMHRLGMIPHARLAEIGRYLGIHTLTEDERMEYHNEALKLGVVLMDGVLADYTVKRSNGKKDAIMLLIETRRKRMLRKEAKGIRATEKKKKRDKKPKVSKQTRLTDYHDMATRAYGSALRDPVVFGTEDSRRMDAGVG